MPDNKNTNEDAAGLHTGPDMSESIKNAQVITSVDDKPDHDGATLATTNHEVIAHWAEERGGTPATVEATKHGDHLGVLQIDFVHDDGSLSQVSWNEWFDTFDARKLNFVYQETKSDGSQSTFHRLDNPEREDG